MIIDKIIESGLISFGYMLESSIVFSLYIRDKHRYIDFVMKFFLGGCEQKIVFHQVQFYRMNEFLEKLSNNIHILLDRMKNNVPKRQEEMNGIDIKVFDGEIEGDDPIELINYNDVMTLSLFVLDRDGYQRIYLNMNKASDDYFGPPQIISAFEVDDSVKTLTNIKKEIDYLYDEVNNSFMEYFDNYRDNLWGNRNNEDT